MSYKRPRRVMSDLGEQRYRTKVEDPINRARYDAEVDRKHAEMNRAAAEARAPLIKGYGAAKARLDEMNRTGDRKKIKALVRAAYHAGHAGHAGHTRRK